MKKVFFDANKVREAAAGNWLAILATLAPHIEGALKRPGRHVGCPIHGGKDGFRLFKDVDQTGGGVCNSCGPKKDGISLLMWLCSWDYPSALSHVAGLLGVEPESRSNDKKVKHSKPVPAEQSSHEHPAKPAGAPLSVHEGQALKWGEANYQHKASNGRSFFLELKSEGGTTVLWGWNLKPLTAELKQGQLVRLSKYGRGAGNCTQWFVESLETTEINSPEPATNEPMFDQSNVVSLYRDKPWLREVQAQIQKRLERETEYATHLKGRIAQIWEQCLPLCANEAAPGRMYLNNRAVGAHGVSQDALRFHPSLPYHDEEGNKVGEYPCLVAAICDMDGDLVTLHRTYLSDNGTKAKIPGGGSVKKMMPIPHGLDVKGCAIQLIDAEESGVIGIAEGMETALSTYRATGIPAWAAVSAVLLECFEVPEHVHTVVIWADKDRSLTGELSANALVERLTKQGVSAHVMLPSTAIPALSKSIDWNDVLVREGSLGFPDPRLIRLIKEQKG